MTGNERLYKIDFKKLFFQNVLAFIDLFIDTIISVISSTQIACDVMCVQYVQKQPPEVFYNKKGVLKNFANLTEKHLCWSLFLIKMEAWETPAQMFSCEISKIFKSTYFEEHLQTTTDQMICNKILLEKIRAMFRI